MSEAATSWTVALQPPLSIGILQARTPEWVGDGSHPASVHWCLRIRVCLCELGGYASAPGPRSALRELTDGGVWSSLAGVTFSGHSCLVQGHPLGITALYLQCDLGLS